MKPKTSIFWRLHQLFFGFTLAVYALTYFAWTGHWIAGFMMMSLPILLIVHALLFIFWMMYRPKRAWLSALALLLSYPFWARTYGGGGPSRAEAAGGKPLTVLSYNVMSFDVLRYVGKDSSKNTMRLIQWAKTKEADIKCFQEFYNNDRRPRLNTLRQLQDAGYPYYAALHPGAAKNEQYFFGLVILSKYPIVGRGEKEFKHQNGMIYADVKVGKDTIRVINVHLRSMIVRFGGLKEAYQDKDYQQGKSETRKVLAKLKNGFVYHKHETDWLTEWIAQSPYPVLVCGDFNETPYGYAYGQVRKKLTNAFEEAGKGFGFSYQNAPRFIRIDNQFYDPKKLDVIDFQTLNTIKYSDHYPVLGRYRLL